MAFSRKIEPLEEPTSDQLTANMAGIGMNFEAKPNRKANIEDTIFFASIDGMDRFDFRTLSVLTMWLGVYWRWVNVDRLVQLVEARGSERVKAYWTAVGRWQKTDPRCRRLKELYKGSPVDLLPGGTDFLLTRNGEDERFGAGPIRIPKKTLRERKMDVIEPSLIQRHNSFLRYRVLAGPTYRSDMLALLELNPGFSPSELARRAYGSYQTAWNTKNDWKVIHGN
jgi:hypothetical protein